MISTDVQYRILTGFDDSSVTPKQWNNLLAESSTNEIFLTWQYQKAWWETFGRGKLLLVTASQNDELKLIAPLFADSGMIYFVGSGGSDYLDFVGDLEDSEMLAGILQTAIKQVPDFLGLLFYHIPSTSITCQQLTEVSTQLELNCFEEGESVAPRMELKKFPKQSLEATRKKSLLRSEAWLIKTGGISVEHLSNSTEIAPHLDSFFQQHIERWKPTSFPSLFLKADHRSFYQRLTRELSNTRWLRFTRILWNGKAVAYHFGFNYNGSFLWYKPSFEITLSKNSPGEVLLRQLILQAINEDAIIFDFGLGDEAFKKRFQTDIIEVKSWGMYP